MDGSVENDDWPIYAVFVTDPGPNRPKVFALNRRTLGVTPAAAKRLLRLPRVEVARGPRMLIERIAAVFQAAGATVELFAD